jgi:hypothetical protein
MARIKKRSGEMQEFDRQKLEESIRRAGASDEAARRVAERVRPVEGTTTEELRRMVSQELGRENSALSGAYTSTRKLRARSAADLASGVALLNEDILKKHGLEPGQNAYVVHMDKRADVQVRMADSVDQAEILMSRSDLEKLGASDGTRVNIRLKA